MSLKTGFYILGKLLGYRNASFTNRQTGEVKDRHTLGIQLQQPDNYGSFNTYTLEIKVDEYLVNEAFRKMIEQFKNKDVFVLVSPREWVMDDGRKGITYYFDSNSTIQLYE